jgi:hypothetical protein
VVIDDDERAAIRERANDALRRADASLRAPRPHAGAIDRWAATMPKEPKDPKPMASQSPEYITKADAREAQDRVEQAIGIVAERQRDALEQRSATLFDLLAELDARWTEIDARVAKLEAAMSIAPTSGDEVVN